MSPSAFFFRVPAPCWLGGPRRTSNSPMPDIILSRVFSSFTSYAPCQLLWGYIIRRFGPRLAATVGPVIWGLTLILSGAAASICSLIFARCLLGAGEGFITPVCHTFVANWFPSNERGRATAVWLNGMTISQVIAGPLVVGLIAASDWRWVF